MNSSMYIMPWNKELETGNQIIDGHHKTFFKSANRFIIKVRAQKELEAAKDQLEFLQDYLLYHFQVEETFQVESGYPGYADHQAEHKHLSFKVKEISTHLKVYDFSTETIQTFCAFVNEWIVNHIIGSDLIFIKYYKAWMAEQEKNTTKG